MSILSFVSDLLIGLLGGYFLGLLGTGSGLTFVKCLNDLRCAVETKNFDLSTWVPTVLMMVWWGLVTIVFFGAPFAIVIELPGDLSGDRVLVRIVAFYLGSFIFIRSVFFGIRSVVAGDKGLRERIRDEF